MTKEIRSVADSPKEQTHSNVIATPEGDNEMAPDQPLQPSSDAAVSGLMTPRGSASDDEYKKDKS